MFLRHGYSCSDQGQYFHSSKTDFLTVGYIFPIRLHNSKTIISIFSYWNYHEIYLMFTT